MNVEEIREYCLSKTGASESFPFDSETIVFKVAGKMFLLMNIEEKPVQFNAKCDPTEAMRLREQYNCVLPGYHMNKKHWNTVICDGTAPKKEIFDWIDNSYKLVVNPKSGVKAQKRKA